MVAACPYRLQGWTAIMPSKWKISSTKLIHCSLLLAVVVALVVMIGCWEEEMVNKPEEAMVEAIKYVNSLTVFFGHQSVGGNILDGLQDLDGWQAPIVEIHNGEDHSGMESGGVLHAYMGKNGFPDTKIADFAKFLRSDVAYAVDIAFMKFCYVDPSQINDVESIFRLYAEALAELAKEFPNITFVHFTIPLMSQRRGMKDRIKQILGMETQGREGNVLRGRYNRLLRQEFGDTGNVFDIATVESTRMNGKRETFRLDGETYDAMVPAYTSDGGHLNELGQRVVAEQLVMFLAELDVRH